MNYRKVYSKCMKLGKEKTPEGATARKKAALIKYKHILKVKPGRKRETVYKKGKLTKGNSAAYKHGFTTKEAKKNKKVVDWREKFAEDVAGLDRLLNDLYAYDRVVIPIKMLGMKREGRLKIEG